MKAGRYAEAQRAVDAYLGAGTPAHAGQAHFVAGLVYHGAPSMDALGAATANWTDTLELKVCP